MAKQTGQITVLKNNTVTNVEFQVRFIFTKSSGERITRDTTAKGVINFDIPNGDWNVSWFAVNGDQKVLPLRAGLQLKITNLTPPTVLADWIYGDNTHVADPILAQWTTALDEMKSVRDQFRDETQIAGSSKAKFLKQGYRGIASASEDTTLVYIFGAPETGFYYIRSDDDLNFIHLTPENRTTCYVAVEKFRDGYIKLTWSYSTQSRETYEIRKENGEWQKAIEVRSSINSNGFVKAASPIIKLFNDRIETNGQFKEDPIFEKIGVGTYKISNTLGLAKEGWTYEKPRGKDGNPYFRIVVEKTDDGCIVSVHDEYVDYENKEIIDSDGNKRTVKERITVLSAARDIKDHERWIDLRFHEEPEEYQGEE